MADSQSNRHARHPSSSRSSPKSVITVAVAVAVDLVPPRKDCRHNEEDEKGFNPYPHYTTHNMQTSFHWTGIRVLEAAEDDELTMEWHALRSY